MCYAAIKTGRYTHEKKTRDIEEVKRLQQQQRMQMNGTLVPCKSEKKEVELDSIIRHITASHQEQTPHTAEFFEKLPQLEKEFLVRHNYDCNDINVIRKAIGKIQPKAMLRINFIYGAKMTNMLCNKRCVFSR